MITSINLVINNNTKQCELTGFSQDIKQLIFEIWYHFHRQSFFMRRYTLVFSSSWEWSNKTKNAISHFCFIVNPKPILFFWKLATQSCNINYVFIVGFCRNPVALINHANSGSIHFGQYTAVEHRKRHRRLLSNSQPYNRKSF